MQLEGKLCFPQRKTRIPHWWGVMPPREFCSFCWMMIWSFGARAMANISADYVCAHTIVAAGALLSLVSVLSSPDFLCQRYAVMGVGNLATNQANQKKILQEGAQPSYFPWPTRVVTWSHSDIQHWHLPIYLQPRLFI
mgnify:CR=1 FL=1